jgi:hypothetical protein
LRGENPKNSVELNGSCARREQRLYRRRIADVAQDVDHLAPVLHLRQVLEQRPTARRSRGLPS